MKKNVFLVLIVLIGASGCSRRVIGDDLVKFDIDCLVRDKVISDADPHPRSSKVAANGKSYHGLYHVDLRAMKLCTDKYCSLPNNEGIVDIQNLTPDQLAILVTNNVSEMVDRHTGRYERVYMEEGRTVFTTGKCRVKPFTGKF